ncbi:Aspartate beta-hydroxylase domain-containing protein 2 [Gracilariopsis chorda]|uniref:Aspartate beta-hydroxylase domain-containing protein 2 n=1 Tax=Gracilariopsis chorda TaxID=448386 RepID=A0A2V3J2T9_9FLOR|nr:Aspartate beta-hydroxylase domain-containing protein 2 [Gracilariopsis chorda]|eukprot:PXF48422.1 Aspartate beta-hydroxylase domain-containing protein 2 [Gracilariopsis chorda]
MRFAEQGIPAFAVSSNFLGFSTKHCRAGISSLTITPLQVARRKYVRSPRVEVHKEPIRAEGSFTETIKRAVENEFAGKNVSRVLNSFHDAMQGRELDVGKGTPRHQMATSFIEGLDAVPFYDDFTSNDSQLRWVEHLEQNWEVIANELKAVTSQKDIQTRGNNIWVPPVVEDAMSYGPDWRTLVLQDREWDPINMKLFPETVKILRDETADVPSVEAFFAKQAPNTGIKLHTDYCNFILTMHLALSAPRDMSWIEVGGERRYWENGKGLVFNTSFFHQTMNESEDQERHVLLIRFWHPELSEVERKALSFLFTIIENPATHPATLKAASQLREEAQSRQTKRRKSNARGRGFAK